MSMQNKHFKKAPLLVALSAVIGLQACSAIPKIDKKIETDEVEVRQHLTMMRDKRSDGAVVRMKAPKLAGDEVISKDVAPLPPVFHSAFAYVTPSQSLQEILTTIERRTGIPTSIQSNATRNGTAAGIASASSLSDMSFGMIFDTPFSPISVSWKGDLKGLLDDLAARSGLYWKLDGGRIHFFKTETKSFHVFLPSGKREITSEMGLAGTSTGQSSGATSSSGSGGGQSSVSVSSEIEIDAYAAILKAVKQMVASEDSATVAGGGGGGGGAAASGGSSNDDGRVVSNPSLGMITVTSTPPVLERVSSYIRGVNERFAQNVMIGIKVYNLDLDRTSNFGAQLDLAYQNLAQKYGVSLSSATPLSPANGTAGRLIFDPLETADRFKGANVMLQALEQLGNVSLVTSGQVIAANGQPSPLQVANQTTYLASSSQTVAEGGMTTQSLEPGVITSGFTANFLPMILGDNRIMLQYQINLSSLTRIDEVASAESKIQTPVTAFQSLQQQAFLKDGQSIVLFGFEQERSSSGKLWGISGGGINSDKKSSMMVIVMEVYSGK